MASVLVAPPTPHYYYTFTFHFAPRRTQAPQFHISLRDHPTSPLVYSHLTLSSHAHDALHFHFSLRPHAISALPASARNSHLTYDFLRVFTFHFSKNANFHVSLSGQKLGTLLPCIHGDHSDDDCWTNNWHTPAPHAATRRAGAACGLSRRSIVAKL